MAYVISHLAPDGDIEVSCETPEEALPIVRRLIDRKAEGILVARYETGIQALETLLVLVEHRSSTEAPIDSSRH